MSLGTGTSRRPDISRRPGRWIDDWRPNDETFWRTTGRRVTVRNLIWSILAEHLAFAIWLLWSVVVLFLPAAGFELSVDQLFWLVALPNLVGAALRIPYTFAVPRFGGRNWTVVSVLLLAVPVGLLAYTVSDPETPYWVLLLVAATAGLGGGNFASSMSNISFFYPERKKGSGLGLNAAGGNLGTSTVQFLVPAVITLGAGGTLVYAGLIWLPLIVLSALGAWFFMDNLTVSKAPLRGQLDACRSRHTWVVSLLYIGTFGSFIGYSAAYGLLANQIFPDSAAASYAFLGAMLGSLIRPLGGWLADRWSGATVTLWSFAGMIGGMLLVLQSVRSGSVTLFVAAFAVLFAASGVGNGSTYRMIPAIFRAEAERDAASGRPEVANVSLTKASAAIGIISAVGAFGGFLIPRAYGTSLAATGSVVAAVLGSILFYACCFAVTWWCYQRTQVVGERASPLARASI